MLGVCHIGGGFFFVIGSGLLPIGVGSVPHFHFRGVLELFPMDVGSVPHFCMCISSPVGNLVVGSFWLRRGQSRVVHLGWCRCWVCAPFDFVDGMWQVLLRCWSWLGRSLCLGVCRIFVMDGLSKS